MLRTCNKTRLMVPLLILGIGTVSLAADGSLLQSTDVFVSGQDGYHMYRIPAIETASDGSLLAFAEARKYSGADPGFGKQDIDLVYKRSRDQGVTWSAMQVIEDPGEGWSAANPATVVDRQTGRLWLLYRNNLVVRVSSADGQSFGSGKPIATGPAAYSDLTVLKDQTVGIFWERDNYKYVTFTRISREFFASSAGKDE